MEQSKIKAGVSKVSKLELETFSINSNVCHKLSVKKNTVTCDLSTRRYLLIFVYT